MIEDMKNYNKYKISDTDGKHNKIYLNEEKYDGSKNNDGSKIKDG